MNIQVVSTGRCGTTLLAKLSEKLDIKIEHQVKGSRLMNILSNMQYLGLLPARIVLRYYQRFCSVNGVPNSTSDPLRSMAFVLWIRQQNVKPNIKVLHLVRSRESFISSFMRWKQTSLKRYLLHHIIPFWTPVSRVAFLLEGGKWISKKEHFSVVWEKKNNVFASLQEVSGIEYVQLSFEDLVICDKHALELLSSVLNVEVSKIESILMSLGKVNNS